MKSSLWVSKRSHDGDIQSIVIYADDVSALITDLRELLRRGLTINIVFLRRYICFTKKLSRQKMLLFENFLGESLSSHVYLVTVVQDHEKTPQIDRF